MPIISDKKALTQIKEAQASCKVCFKKPLRTTRILICDICCEWICGECSCVTDALYEVAAKLETNVNFNCCLCEQQLPKIRDLVNLNQRQDKLEEDLNKIKEDINENATDIKNHKGETKEMDQRLKKVEKFLGIDEAELSEEFPSLSEAINQTTKTLAERLSTQDDRTKKLDKELQKQQEMTIEEKRIESRALNLIIYGLPESEGDVTEQMKQDFLDLQEVISDRVFIQENDITDIRRLGIKKDKPRPIRITCATSEKRKEILTNNKNLRIEHEQFEVCPCKYNPGKHVHINITNDKTKKQQEDEAKLRNELKQRRSAGENIIIKKGKIVNVGKTSTQPRWVELIKDGL